jgi:predicted  nucleic acid-binding Zn-ribbon protein
LSNTIAALIQLSALDEQREMDPGAAGAKRSNRRTVGAIQKVRHQISDDLLATYDALHRSGRRPAVVPAREGVCGGCSIRLPAQTAQQLHVATEIVTCPRCHRFLYVSDRREETQP